MPGEGNIGSKQGGNREHWVKHVREQGTLGKTLPGTGNIGSNVPGNREHGTPPIRASLLMVSSITGRTRG